MTAKRKGAKKGAFSAAERSFIVKYRGELSPAEIAKKLGRNEGGVLNEMARIDGLPIPGRVRKKPDAAVELSPAQELKDSAAWKQLKEELLPEEVAYFKEQFEELMSQFKDDVLAAEKTQIFKVIRLAVFMNRVSRELKMVAAEWNDKQRLAQGLAAKIAAGLADEKEAEMHHAVTLRMADLFAQRSQLTKDYSQLEDKHQGLMEDLKATRKQRVDRIETGTIDLFGVIRNITVDDRVRRDSERLIELGRITYAKELVRLAKPYRYPDAVVDQPLLNAETVTMFPDYVPPVKPA